MNVQPPVSRTSSGLRQLNLNYGLAVALLIVTGILSFSSLRRMSSALDWVGHTQLVISEISDLENSLLRVRASVRLYILTDNESNLDVYKQQLIDIPAGLDDLEKLMVDNEEQLARVRELRPMMMERLDRARLLIEIKRTQPFSDVVAFVKRPEGIAFNRRLDTLLSELKRTEKSYLEVRRSALSESVNQTAILILAATIVACVVALFARRSMAIDLRKRHAAQAALRASENRLQLVSRATQDAVWDWDVTQDFVTWNSAMTTLFGHSTETATSLTSEFDRVHPDDREEFRVKNEKWLNDPSTTHWSNEYRYRRGDGSYASVFARAFVIRDEKGKATRTVGALMDMTERRNLEVQLIDAREQALAASKLKSEFLANMSHEIRTPMNGVIGMTGLLLDTKLDDQQQDFAETIRTSADSLLTIINDILDFSKIEAGKLSLEITDFDLRSIVESTLDILAPTAHEKGLELIFEMQEPTARGLRGDAGRLRQILMNLVSNAVKFTKKGEVAVHITNERDVEGSSVLRFEVRDTGIGIPKDVQGVLFQAFVQADGSTARKFGGTGLGLAISRQLVEMMGGEIGLISEPGQGSRFWFRLKLERALTVTPARRAVEVDLTRERVLVVDDNETNRRILRHQLANWRIRADELADPLEVIEALMRARAQGDAYTLVILDMQMPKLDGIALAQRIRETADLNKVKLLLMTSMGMTGADARFKASGIAECLSKPVKQSHLFDAIVRVLTSTDSNTMTASSKLEDAKPRATARILIAEDNPINQRVAIAQLAKLGYASDAVGNGREALDVLKTIDYDLVLMDCQMPEMDGYEATRLIRKTEKRQIPIIAMTANAMEGDRERCIESGMDDHLPKPVKPEALAAMLEKWLKPSLKKTLTGS